MNKKKLIEEIISDIGILKLNVQLLNKIETLQTEVINKKENSFKDYMAMIGSAYKLNEILKTLPKHVKDKYEYKFKILWEQWYEKSKQFLEKDI